MDKKTKQYLDAWTRFLVSQDYNLALTLTLNEPRKVIIKKDDTAETIAYYKKKAQEDHLKQKTIYPDQAYKKLNFLNQRLNKKVHGSRFYKKPKDELINFFGLGTYNESETNYHFHLCVKTIRPERILENVEIEWKKIVPSGTSDVQLINKPEGWCLYVSRHLFKPEPRYAFSGEMNEK